MKEVPLPPRIEYGDRALSEADLKDEPLGLFSLWMEEAVMAGIPEANGCCLATISETGCPDARIVLLKGADLDGFHFFTNYQSAKGRQLEGLGKACLVFWWQALRRQVRVAGSVLPTRPEICDQYFAGRPREAQLGAWASAQSRPLSSREELEQKLQEVRTRFAGVEEVPRPPYWGGYTLTPDSYEFWQGRDSRLHDRFQYRALSSGWEVCRLSP